MDPLRRWCGIHRAQGSAATRPPGTRRALGGAAPGVVCSDVRLTALMRSINDECLFDPQPRFAQPGIGMLQTCGGAGCSDPRPVPLT